MKVSLKKIAGFAGTALLIACSSPLSDLEVTDPDLLHPTFTVEKTINDGGNSNNSITAYIADKNGASVELKNGTVKCNGDAMKYTLLNYQGEGKVKSGKTYEFEVVLPNESSYKGTVSGAKEIKGIQWPKSLEKNKSVHMKWLPGKGKNITLILNVQDEKNSYHEVHKHFIGEDNKYFLELPKYDFPENMNGKAQIILINEEKGSISDEFGGGEAVSRTKYIKEIAIK